MSEGKKFQPLLKMVNVKGAEFHFVDEIDWVVQELIDGKHYYGIISNGHPLNGEIYNTNNKRVRIPCIENDLMKESQFLGAWVVFFGLSNHPKYFPDVPIVYDIIPLAAFNDNYSPMLYQVRYSLSKALALRLGWYFPQNIYVRSLSDALQATRVVIEEEGKGVALKRLDAPWQAGKPTPDYIEITQEDLDESDIESSKLGTGTVHSRNGEVQARPRSATEYGQD